jgi:hypothetical protein
MSLFVNNSILVNSAPPSPSSSIYMYTSVALGQVLINCVALLWVAVDQPILTSAY